MKSVFLAVTNTTIETLPEYDYKPLLIKLDKISDRLDLTYTLLEFGFAFMSGVLCSYFLIKILFNRWGD